MCVAALLHRGRRIGDGAEAEALQEMTATCQPLTLHGATEDPIRSTLHVLKQRQHSVLLESGDLYSINGLGLWTALNLSRLEDSVGL